MDMDLTAFAEKIGWSQARLKASRAKPDLEDRPGPRHGCGLALLIGFTSVLKQHSRCFAVKVFGDTMLSTENWSL